MFEVFRSDRAALDLEIGIDRRYAHHLSRLHARIRLHPAAIHTHLAGAQKLLQLPETKSRIMNLEPAIEAHTGLVGPDLDMLDTCHEISSLSVLIARPIRRRAVWTKPLEQTAAQGQPGENRRDGNSEACKHVNGR